MVIKSLTLPYVNATIFRAGGRKAVISTVVVASCSEASAEWRDLLFHQTAGLSTPQSLTALPRSI
ncbi:MAG: hypothetical protein ABJA69_06105 [Acidobacteriaceae bacterium]